MAINQSDILRYEAQASTKRSAELIKEAKAGSSLFPVGTGGLDAHGMMTGDDTGGDVWTVAGAWEGLACSRGAA